MRKKDNYFEGLVSEVVAYRPTLAKAFGSVKLAILWWQLYYWSDKGFDPNGWIYKTRDDIYEETGLSRYEQETARERGRKLGILHEVKKSVPRRLHFKVDKIVAAKLIEQYLKENPPTSRRGNHQQAGGSIASSMEEKQPAITENTTENTKKNTAVVKSPRQQFSKILNKEFFKEAKEWAESNHSVLGGHMEEMLEWFKENYNEAALRELDKFIEYWTSKDNYSNSDRQLWETETNFKVYHRINYWFKKANSIDKNKPKAMVL